jgi:hypothetical protein
VTGTGAEVEGQAVIEEEVEGVIEVAHIGPITAILTDPDGRHRARPALALALLTALVILHQIDLLLEVPLDLPPSTTVDQI